jgi:uncharacterized protein YdbL (DUF1318 family)
MNTLRLFRRLALGLAGLALAAALPAAEDRTAILARMEQRLASVDELKEKKLVGENNRGYLEGRAALDGPQQGVVSAENSDRQALYALIAKQQGVNIEQVGRGRAQRIAAASKRGVWLQGNDSVWYQKP